jgi:hypothetical protein
VQRAGLPIAESGYVPAGSEQPYVLLDGEATRTLFDTVIRDTELPPELLAEEAPPAEEEAPAAAEEPEPEPAPVADGLTVPPGQVTVDVLNATGTKGLAATAAEALTAQGFTIADVGNAPEPVASSVVRHGPDGAEQARTVAAAVPGAVLQGDPALAGKVQLVLGPGYTSVVAVEMPAAPAPEPAADTPAAASTSPAPVSCG